ncbi:MAG: hypothetical protein ACYDGR_12480 [Candidatus Dormibacteria bacterium]
MEARDEDRTLALWERFLVQHAATLTRWIEAERRVRDAGPANSAGEALLAAEAALQRSIVDFAVIETGGVDSAVDALDLLRRAEAMLRG